VGLPIADPIIALAITGMIGHITWEAWKTVHPHHH
jgi:divalent metal cation (Fe/Co/Zn/Cd) transporter